MENEGHVKIGTELDESGFKKGLSGLGNLAKTGLATVGKVTTAAIGSASAAVAALGAASVAAGKGFETSMAKASTLFGDITVDTEKLNESILKISDSTGIAASELNESLYSALSAGIPVTEDMSDATAFLESSAKLAKAGFTDMDTALTATAKTLNAYGLDVSEADRINKILIQTQNKGITTVGELGASLAQVTPTAAAFGVSFENVGAALSNMTAAGTPTAQATTQLNSLIAELGKSGTTGAKSLEAAAKGTEYAGMSFKEMMDAGIPLNEVLDLINASAEKSGLSMVDMFSSIEAGKAALALSGENSEKFASNLEAMGTSADVVTEAYEKVTNTLETKTEQLQNSAQNLGIKIYQGMQEPLMGLADMGLGYLQELTDAFTSNGVDGLVDAGAGIVIDFAAGIAGEIPGLIDIGADIILKLLSALQSNLGSLASVGMDIISSLASGVVGFLPQLFDIGGQLLQMLYDGVIAGIPLLFNAAADMANNMASGLDEKIPEFIDKALDMVQTFATTLAENAPVLVSAGINLLSNLVKGIVDSLPTMIEKLPQIISTFANIINDNAPTILQAGINLIVTLVQGIISAVPALIANIPQIIQAIVDVWSAFNWIDLGRNAITFLQKGILGMAGAVKSAGTSILNGITGSLKQLPGKLLSLGKSGISSLGSALKGGLSTVTGHAKSILKGIIDTFKPNSLLEVGKNLIKGLWKGITSMSGWILKQIKGFCDSVVDGIKDFLDIHSPSRRMAKEVGKPVAEGTAKGITDNLDVVEAATDEMGETILESGKEIAELVGEQMEDSLQSEESYWNSMVAATRRGVLGQKDAVASLVDTKSDMLTNVTALYNNYISKLGETTDELMKATGLFDEVTKKTGVNSDTLMKNLQDQVNMYGEYWTVMQQLKSRITNEGLLSALEDMGVDSLAELQALNSMTDDELAQYAALYDQKYAMCNAIAADSLSELRSQTETELAKMLGVTNVNLDEFARTFDGTLDSIELYIEQTVTDVGELQDAMYDNGQNIMAGLIDGMESMKDDLEKTTAEMIKIAANAAAKAGEIHSPSRLFRRRIGKNIIAGINVGMEDETDSLEATSRDMVARSVKAMQQADAGEAVARFQSQSSRHSEVAGSDDPWKYPKDPGYDAPPSDTPQILVLEKGSIEGEVTMEGQKVGKIVAPTVDKELGVISRGKERKK